MNSPKQSNAKEAAKKYVDEQLNLLRKYGSTAKVSKSAYESIVKQVVRVAGK